MTEHWTGECQRGRCTRARSNTVKQSMTQQWTRGLGTSRKLDAPAQHTGLEVDESTTQRRRRLMITFHGTMIIHFRPGPIRSFIGACGDLRFCVWHLSFVRKTLKFNSRFVFLI